MTARDASADRPFRGLLSVDALVRGPQPELRAALAERTLVRTVSEWEAGSGLVIDLQASANGESVRMTMHPIGGATHDDWADDVVRALSGIAKTTRCTSTGQGSASPTALVEVERDPARARRRVDDEDQLSPLSTSVERGQRAIEVAWPEAVHDPSGNVLEALRGLPHAFVRQLVAAPTDLERAMLHEELSAAWSGGPAVLDGYLGSPVRMRAFAGLRGAGSPATLRAAVRGWGTALAFRETTEEERLTFDSLDADALVGFVRPEGWALALLRLPTSGERPVRGMRSVPPAVAEHPLDAPPSQTSDALVLGTARTVDGETVPLRMAASDLARHAAIEGRSGAGKTRLITAIIGELSRLDIGCTLLEHHGSGVDQALRALDPSAAERAIVVRHGDAHAPGSISLFDEADPDRREQMIAEFTELVQTIFDPGGQGIVGPRWRRWFTLLCDAVGTYFGREATLLHVLSIASDPSKVTRLAVRLAPIDRDLARRLGREVGELSGDEAVSLPAWAISKFQPLVGQRAMREILGRPRDSVDVARVIDEGRVLLVDLGGGALGTPSARMLGSLWLLKHWVAMGRRADRSRPHFIIVDEARLMTFGALPAMLAEARKFGFGIIIASQTIEGLAPALQSEIEANVGSHFSFRLGLNTAGRAAARLGAWPVGELVRLPDLRAATTLMRDGVPSEPFLLSVPAWPAPDPVAERQAAEIEARRVQEWAATMAHPVVTDADVSAALEDRTQRSGRARHPAPRVPSTGGEDAATDGLPLFDQWLADRRATASS